MTLCSDTAIIAGGVVASIIVVGLFAIAAILLLKRKKRVEGEGEHLLRIWIIPCLCGIEVQM